MSQRKVEGSKRPYRLWDANAKAQLRWRYYSNPKRAHLGALIETRWSKVGTVVEVINSDNGRLLGQYRRTPNSVTFTGA